MKCKKCGGNRTKAKCKLCEMFAAAGGPGGQMPAGWPRESLALGVAVPDQIQPMMDHCKKVGVPTEYTPTGRAIVRNPTHQRELTKALGYVDRDSFI